MLHRKPAHVRYRYIFSTHIFPAAFFLAAVPAAAHFSATVPLAARFLVVTPPAERFLSAIPQIAYFLFVLPPTARFAAYFLPHIFCYTSWRILWRTFWLPFLRLTSECQFSPQPAFHLSPGSPISEPAHLHTQSPPRLRIHTLNSHLHATGLHPKSSSRLRYPLAIHCVFHLLS